MNIEVRMLYIIQSILVIIVIFITCIYSIPIIFIRRFHHPNNMFTLNVCIATILCCFSWLPFYITNSFDDDEDVLINPSATFVYILRMIFTMEVPCSLVVASIHRYCSLVYHTQIFFKKKRWYISCIGIQWLLGILIAIPIAACVNIECLLSLWPYVYSLIAIVVAPSILCFAINILIYHHVRSSSRRIHPQTISENILQTKINQRDMILLRHMIIMFCVFVGGWSPTFIIPIIDYYTPVDPIIDSSLSMLCELSLLFNTIDLFLYNHEIRKYLKDLCCH